MKVKKYKFLSDVEDSDLGITVNKGKFTMVLLLTKVVLHFI